MNTPAAPSPVKIAEEISALIATLLGAEQRLDELPSGELDAVADSEGQIFLLRRAQDYLRMSQSAKQEAILNALPAHIALLDAEGVIESVNDGWRKFARHNELLTPGHAVGLDYLGVCDAASGKDATGASLAAKGIRSVLQSEAKTFSLEYPCDSPAEQRWFLMTVTPLSEIDRNGAVVMHLDITQRRRAEAELRELSLSTAKRERVLSTTLASITDFAYIFDRDGRFLFANQPLLDLLGITLDEIVGRNFHDLAYPPDLASKLQEQIELVFRTADIVTDETPFTSASGEDGCYEYILAPVRSPEGATEFVVGSTRDVTERKRQAWLLETEKSRLVAAQRVAKIGSWETDISSGEVIWSEETHRIFQTDPATFIPTHPTFLEIIHPADRAEVGAAFERSFGQRAACAIEHRLLLPGGVEKSVEERWQVIFDEFDRPVRAIGTCQDITEKVQGKQALARFRAAMDISADAIVLVDRNTMLYIDVNQTTCDVSGYSREQLLAMTPMDLTGRSRELLEKEYDALIADNASVGDTIEGQYLHTDGATVFVETRRRALRTGAGWVIVGTTRNVTPAIKAAESLRRFRAAMDVSGDAIILVDRQTMRYIDVNQTLCDLIGRTREELIGMTPMEVFSADRETLEREYDAIIADPNSSSSKAIGHYRHKDGSVIPVESRRRALRIGTGWVIVGTARDITERLASEARITYLNRVFAVLSGINTLIVRVSSREELFREACRVAVDAGGFRAAWIGIVDAGKGRIEVAASAGANEDLLAIIEKRFSMGGSAPLGDSLTARAIREKKLLVSNDSLGDPGIWIPHHQAYAGLRSMAILPLIVGDEAVGALALYAGEADFFHEEELKLLTELAGDIAFAIDHIEKQSRLDHLAYYDLLTGLPNRKLFLERVTQFMRLAAGEDHAFAMFFIDIERFKNINESLGRPAGDELLRQIAKLLVAGEGDASMVARIGADHFAVVMPEVRLKADVERFLADRIDRFQRHPFILDDAVFRLAMKVGVSMFPGDGADADTLLRNAEAALSQAKASGDRYLFYARKMTDRGAGRLTLENRMRRALDNEEFVLHYQPKISLHTGKLTSAEALIRWNDPEKGLVPPGLFIPTLEETGLIHEAGRWALRKAIAVYLGWRAAGLPAVRIAVNVSPLQLRGRGFVDEIAQVTGIHPHGADGIELEITESLIMEDVKHSIASLQAIRDMKVTVAIDDFGTGFSSLSYLSKLPVDTLKIDRSFVVDMTSGPDGLSLVSTIINLAHSFKLKVVAEGVETEEQSRLLRLLNCNEMQGFLFSRPVPAAEFEAKFLAPPGAGQ